MDWVGTTFRHLLELGWKFEGSQWFDVAWAIAHGISQAHQHGIIHGDLKPGHGSTRLKPLTEKFKSASK
jgi:serine/threonine protein kinase